MQSLVVFALLFGFAVAAPSGYHAPAAYAAPAYAAVPVVSHAKVGYTAHTPLHTVQKVHHTVHPVVTPIHHPPVTTVHQQPTAVLAQAPKISGYAFKSEVNHDVAAKAIAAPVAVAAYAPAPVAVAAPAYAPAPVAVAAPAYAPAAVAVAPAPVAYAAPAPAPYISGSSLSVSPAVIKETPAVSSYSLQTGRIETASQSHYATAHIPTAVKVGYAAPAVYAQPALAVKAPAYGAPY